MPAIKRPSPAGHVIFCDDIRQENTGKLLYIGVYAGHEMNVFAESWPVTIPKFGLAISISGDDKTLLSLTQIRIYLPGDAEESPSLQVPVQSRDMLSAMPEPRFDQDNDLMRGTTNYVVMSPLVINQEGRIRVIACFGDDTFKLGSLKVTRAPPAAMTVAPKIPD
jgi:hypothetical protein